MSAIASRTPAGNPASSQTSQAGVETSSPVGMLTLFWSSLNWLFWASLLGLMNSVKLHQPKLLASQAYLTYGRLHAAQSASFLYGFAVPAALGLGLWLLCRLGRTSLAGPAFVFVGAMLWNMAVTLGVAAILCGGSTGYEYFEMPVWCAPILFAAFLMIGLCGLFTFHQRQQERLYPSQWFVVGALFWFPWIFSTAALTLLFVPARGVLQASTAWWYARNFDTVFLGFAGLASAFYFIPKLLGRPLHSHYLAAFAFWTLALFGGFGGIPESAPLPLWIISLSLVGTVLTLVPILAVTLNFYETVRHHLNMLDADHALRFAYVGLLFWLIAGVQQIVGALPSVSGITDLTWFGAAQKELVHYGFFAMTLSGAVYYIVPSLLNLPNSAWSPKLLRVHFWLMLFGVLISYLSLLVAGIDQGLLMANTGNSFIEVMLRTMMPLRMSTLGDLLVVVSIAVFLANFVGMVMQSCRQCFAAWKEAL